MPWSCRGPAVVHECCRDIDMLWRWTGSNDGSGLMVFHLKRVQSYDGHFRSDNSSRVQGRGVGAGLGGLGYGGRSSRRR
jgi:hypothetical protein